MDARWAGRSLSDLERPATAYAVIAGALVLATVIRALVGIFVPDSPNFMAFFPAVLVGALLRGLRGGLIATAASVVAIWVLFIPHGAPAETFRAQHVQLLLFAITAAVTVWIASGLRRALRHGDLLARRLKVMHEQSLDAFVILSPVREAGRIVDFTWTYANAAAERTAPEGVPTLVGRRVREVFPDATGAEMIRRLVEAYDAGGPDDIEVRRLIDGQERWMRSSAMRLDEEIAATYRDITAQRAAEAAATRSRDEFERIANTAPVMIWMSGQDIGATWFNSSWLSFRGRSLEAELGRGWIEGVHPDDVDRLLAAYAERFERREPLRIEYRLRNAGGQYRWIDEVATPSISTDGVFEGYIGACVDITDRRQAETALRTGESRVRALVDSLPQLLWSNRIDGFCDYLSPQWVAYTGVPAEQHRGEGWLEAVHPEDRERVISAFAAAVAAGDPFLVEYRIRRHDGAWRWFHGRAAPVRDDEGTIIRWFGSSSDITEIVEARSHLEAAVAERTRELEASLEERARAEAALAQAQRLETIGRLTGGVAHDFNNLLTVIIGGLDMIQRRPDDTARVTRLAEAALAAGRRGERLTRQLLAFARRQELKPEILDLAALIQQVEPLVRRAVGANVALTVDAEPDLGVAQLDSAQFEAALLNLVVNASDAVGSAGRITVSARRRELQGGEVQGASAGVYLAVSVADDGPGMDAEVLSRAFEPFFTTKEVGKGTGLGLAQVYGFVRQCGGAAAIDSAPGQGCCVTLFLPASSGTVTPAADAAPDEDGRTNLAAHILLVEDDPEVRAVTETLLGDLGCRVTVASDASSALVRLKAAEAFDLMLSDIVMPGGMNGVELARAVSTLRPDLPIVLTTGYAGERFDDGGGPVIWPVLRKPFRSEELSALLRDALAAAVQ